MNVRKLTDYSALFWTLDELMEAHLPQIELYCGIGCLVSDRPEKAAAVAATEYLHGAHPDAAGFSPRNLRRMRDFYRTYENGEPRKDCVKENKRHPISQESEQGINPTDFRPLTRYKNGVVNWAQKEVALATKGNLVVCHVDGTFKGASGVTRGDAAVVVYRLFQKIWQLPSLSKKALGAASHARRPQQSKKSAFEQIFSSYQLLDLTWT